MEMDGIKGDRSICGLVMSYVGELCQAQYIPNFFLTFLGHPSKPIVISVRSVTRRARISHGPIKRST